MNTTGNSGTLHKARTPAEWATIEAAEHDSHYQDACPFGRNELTFTVEQALWYEDYCYKKGRARWGHRTRKFLELLEVESLPGKTLLDVGSGTGQLAVLYAKCGARVTGVDLSKTGNDIARRTAAANGVADRCTFIVGDFSQIDFGGQTFDVVALHASLHHLIKYPGVQEKIAGLTRVGGTILMQDTVRGDRVLHRFRRLVKAAADIRPGRRQHEDDLGDVLFGIETYEEFASRFPACEIHMMDYFYMINKVFERLNTKAAPARFVLRMAKALDDVLAKAFPGWRRRFGNAVLAIRT